MSTSGFFSFRSCCAFFFLALVVAARSDARGAPNGSGGPQTQSTPLPGEQPARPPARLQGRIVAAADSSRALSGVLKVTNCSNETSVARAGRKGFEIVFDPTDCARCGEWHVVAQPEDASYLWTTGKISCDTAQPIVLRCSSKSRVLLEIGNAIAVSDWGRATLISSDLLARTGEPKALEAYKAASSEFFSIPRDVAWKTDPQQGKEVATPELVEKIKAFQKDAGLPGTGVINFPTAKRMAVEGRATAGVGSAPLYREIDIIR